METSSTSVPRDWLEGCSAAHRRLEAVIKPLTDEMARRPSLLPGWSIGHLLTHLARNADSLSGMVEAAQKGATIAQYPGGPAQREGDIAAGAGRAAAELVADVSAAQQRLEQAWAATSEETWATGLGLRASGPKSIAEFVFLRWREVEVHLVDLGLPELGSPTWDDLSAPYIQVEWPEMLCGLSQRLPEGITLLLVPGDRPSKAYGKGNEHIIVRATPGRILGWLFGRGGDSTWPALGAWS